MLSCVIDDNGRLQNLALNLARAILQRVAPVALRPPPAAYSYYGQNNNARDYK